MLCDDFLSYMRACKNQTFLLDCYYAQIFKKRELFTSLLLLKFIAVLGFMKIQSVGCVYLKRSGYLIFQMCLIRLTKFPVYRTR